MAIIDTFPQEQYFTAELESGLRILLQHVPSNVAYCGFAVNAGSRDEEDGEEGIAHFVEHMLFKGTHKRKAWHILNRMENVGGDLNAFTNKEETVIYTAFLKQDLDRALELLTDLVFDSVMPQNELEKEKEVVMDEFKSYLDSPSELIFDEFENLIFEGHSMGRNILGTLESIQSFSQETAMRFYCRHYRQDNMVLFLQGDFNPDRTITKIGRIISGIPATRLGKETRMSPDRYLPQTRLEKKDTHQAHVMMGCRCFSASDPRKRALFLLSNILGGPGMNSRLNVNLRERRGLVYDVESSVNCYSDSGSFCIYFGCDKEDVDECIRLAGKEMDALWKVPLSIRALQAAKKQFIGQIGVASDNNENSILDMVKYYLHYNRTSTFQDVVRQIMELKPEDLREAAEILFHEKNRTILIFS